MKTCMFTGHRPKNLPFGSDENDIRCIGLKNLLNEKIREKIGEGYGVFYTGMAMGTDIFAAECVLELKKEFPFIELRAAVPCEDQAKFWSKEQISRYNRILNLCDKVEVLQKNYTPGCMDRRNKYMVDRSDCVIAVWNGEKSGTGSTVGYARKSNKEIVFINPAIL